MPVTHPIPAPRPGRKRRLAAITTLGIAGLLVGLLAGCSSSNSSGMSTSTPASSNSFASVTGNWKFTTGTNSRLSALAGTLTVSGSSVTGTLHPLAATCAAPSDLFQISGTIDASGLLSVTSTDPTGVQLHISGTLAADRHSLTDPSITITGGTCAASAARLGSPVAHVATSSSAQQYQPVTGNYNGSFTDSDGATLAVAASLSQPTTPDANGVYHLTGYATFPNNPCLSAPVITDSTVTGDTIETTYTDSQSGGTVMATGTFSADAQTLTISSWTLSGCGDDTGTGLLSRQSN